ncbi:helix-turn-helix transcriptional regulator [Actinoplanes sp. URMC 104]|uniref:helix-turn-helix transcriptional regulator n=1 Tax=Actinoplanes sp. URMC 104 TaxID=3423409 RepID=UPI003F19B58E
MEFPTGRAAAASRDAHLTLRRVERQQQLIEQLYAGPHRLTLRRLADGHRVTERTIARDLERLRHSGVPITVVPGRGGGATIDRTLSIAPIAFDLPEVAALMASLAALGPTASPSAASAMRKLAAALHAA